MFIRKFLLFFITILFASCAARNTNYFLFKKNNLNKSEANINPPQKVVLDTFENYYSTVRKDGRYLIYVSNKSGNLDLWLYDFLTKNSYRITYHSSDDFMPSFSPDGKKVVFVSYRSDSRGDIWSISFNKILERAEEGPDENYVKDLLKDDESEQITANHIPESEPVFMPDSKYILFVRDEGGKNIFLKKLKLSSSPELIIKNGISPAVSPDGKNIAFINVSSNSNLKNHLCLYNLKNKNIKQLITGNSIETSPVFINSYTLLYSSIKFDSNKNNMIDFNDNSSIFLYDLKKLKEYQITSFQNMDIYPAYTKLYGGSIIYTSTHNNDLNLWMLPIEGIIPFVKNKALQFKMIDNIENDYYKLLGYEKIIEYYPLSDKEKNDILFKEGEIWQQLGYKEQAEKIFLSIPSTNTNLTVSDLRAEKELILLKSKNKIKDLQDLLSKYKYIKYSKHLDLKEAYFSIFYSLSQIYKDNKNFKETIITLKNIISQLNKNSILYKKALTEIIFLYMDINRFTAAENYFVKFLNTQKTNTIKEQDKFLKKYLHLKINLKRSDYKHLLTVFRQHNFFSLNIRYHFGKYFKDKKLLNYLIKNDTTQNKIFKIRALKILIDLTKSRNKKLRYLHNILTFSNVPADILEYTKNKLANIYLNKAKHLFNIKDYINAKTEYKKILKYDADNIDALTGILRCNFKLTKPDEKKYNLLLSPYKKIIARKPYDYKHHYLLGYGYSLIYSHYYNLYLLAMQQGEPSVITKFLNLFKKRKNLKYPSYYKKILDKYFELGKYELQIAYRIKTDSVISYLTLGYLYQLQDDIEPEKNYIRYAIPIYNSALFYNDEEKYPFRESMIYLNLANINFRMKNYSIANKYYNEKLKYSNKFQNLEQEAFFYYHFGYAQWQIGNDEYSSKNFNKAFELFIKTKNNIYAFRSLVFEAMILRFNKKYDESIIAYNRAINFIKEKKLKINYERLLREIGICYLQKHNSKKALEYFHQADKIIPKDKYLHWWQKPCIRVGMLDYTIPVWPVTITLGQSFASLGFKNRDEQKLLYTLIGDAYLRDFNFSEAIKYYLLKKKLLEEDNNKDALPYIYNQLGLIYFKLNNFNISRKYFLLSNTYINKLKIKDYDGIVKNNLNIIQTYLKSEKNINNYFSTAISILNDTYNLIKDKKKNEKLLTAIYEKYGLLYFKKALLKKYNDRLKIKNINTLSEKIKKIYNEYLISLNYYLKAYRLANKIKDYLFAAKIKYNIGKIYYLTGDISTAIKYFNDVYDLSYKYSIDNLKWSVNFIIDKLNNEINYEKYISYIETIPKAYNYNTLSDFNVEELFSGYLKEIYLKRDYKKFIIASERKRNFIIKDIFLSYPIKLRAEDEKYIKRIRDIEYNLIEEKKYLSQLLELKKKDKNKIENVKLKINNMISNRTKLYAELRKKKPYLSYLANKNIIPLEKIQNLIDNDTAFLGFDLNDKGFYSYILTRTNIKLFDFNTTNLRAIKKLADEFYNDGKLKYTESNWITTISSNVKNYNNLIIIPDKYFYLFPFSEVFTNKNISYDISLSQYYFNSIRTPLIFDNVISLNYNFNPDKMKSIQKNLKENLLPSYFQKSSAIHIVDGIKRDKFNPLNFSIIYNEDNTYQISKLSKILFKGEYISIENLDQYYKDRYTFLSTIIPFYYMNSPTLILPLKKYKLKYLIKFWNNFYKDKDDNFVNKLKRYGKDIKIIYGNRGLNLDTKISIQKLKIKSLKDEIYKLQNIGNLTNTITKYKILLNEIKTLNDMSSNKISLIPIYTNLISLYIDTTNYKDALDTISIISNLDQTNHYIISMTSNIKKMLHKKENISVTSELSNIIQSNINNLNLIMSIKTNFTNKLNLINNFLNGIKNDKKIYLQIIIDKFLSENYISTAYKYVRLLKNRTNGEINIPIISTNTVFIDMYANDKNLYMFVLNNTNLNYTKKKKEKVDKYIKNFYNSVEKKESDDMIDALDDISEYILEDIKTEKYSNIIFSPYDNYYNIPYYALRQNNSYIISNKNIIVCKEYNKTLFKYNIKFLKLLSAGYKLNLDGKIIKDFSYKEIESIKDIFKKSYSIINKSLNNIKGNYNAMHIAMSITTNFYIENKYNKEKYKLNKFINRFQPEFLFLSKYGMHNKLLLYKNNIILNLWRYNDAISAIWVKQFYKNLYNDKNFVSSYIKTIRYMLNKYSDPINTFNFYLIK